MMRSRSILTGIAFSAILCWPLHYAQYQAESGGRFLQSDDDDCCETYCYSRDTQPYLMMATKTAYQIVFGKQSTQHRISDCNPIQFWSINRHGTRYPKAKTVARLRQMGQLRDDIVRNYDEHRSYPQRGRLCDSDLELLRRWRWNDSIDESKGNALAPQGLIDMNYLARRYQSRFENLLRLPYSDFNYQFKYTESDRTRDSYKAYVDGLFRNYAYPIHVNAEPNQDLLKPTESCQQWNDRVSNFGQNEEIQRFRHKPVYQQMIRDVFQRLGFRYTLNESLIDDMYDLCRYEKAWNLDVPSAWCTVFTKEQLKLLEYSQDLKHYYRGGYGNGLNQKVGCPPVKDMMDKFTETVRTGRASPAVTVFFTHAVTLETALVALGIANDSTPLTADNYFQQTSRHWRTSRINPFASNLVAVLYQCSSGDRYKVMFFLNEIPVDYPGCSVGLCDWSMVNQKLSPSVADCNLDFCQESGSNTILPPLLLIWTLLSIAVCGLRSI